MATRWPSSTRRSAVRSMPLAGSTTRPCRISSPITNLQLQSLREAKRRSNLVLGGDRFADARDDRQAPIVGSTAFPRSPVLAFSSFFCAETPPQCRHAHGNPVGHLSLDHRVRTIRRIGSDL